MASESLDKIPQKKGSSAKKSRRKKIRYRKMAFKLTSGQLEALERLCRQNKTTPIRFMKSMVNMHVERYRNNPAPVSYVTENQLELFDSDMLSE